MIFFFQAIADIRILSTFATAIERDSYKKNEIMVR